MLGIANKWVLPSGVTHNIDDTTFGVYVTEGCGIMGGLCKVLQLTREGSVINRANRENVLYFWIPHANILKCHLLNFFFFF